MVGYFLRAIHHAGHVELPCAGQLQPWLDGRWIRRPGDHAEYRSHRHVPMGYAPKRRVGEPEYSPILWISYILAYYLRISFITIILSY